MKRIMILTLLVATLIFSAQPRVTGGSTLLAAEPMATVGCAGFVDDRDKAESVDKILTTDLGLQPAAKQALDRPDIPGAEVIVIQRGKIKFLKGYGFSNIERRVPINEQTVFNLASVSKQFTAIAIMKLVEQRKLKLTDRLTSILPEFKRVKGADKIQIRHLLTHTSGLPSYLDVFGVFGQHVKGSNPTNQDVVKLLSRAKGLCFEGELSKPGDEWQYSNSGYVVLAQIVETITKSRFADYMKRTFFDPLGMKSTFVRDERKQSMPNQATAYEKEENRFNDVTQSPLDAIYGDGNVFSTICDLATWLESLRNIFVSDSRRFRTLKRTVISQRSLNRVFTPVLLGDDTNEPRTYGFGWFVFLTADLKEPEDQKDDDFNVDAVLHTGEWRGVRTFIGILPHRGGGLIGILLSNNGELRPCDETDEAEKIARIYLKGVPDIKRFIKCPRPAQPSDNGDSRAGDSCGKLMLDAAFKNLGLQRSALSR